MFVNPELDREHPCSDFLQHGETENIVRQTGDDIVRAHIHNQV